MPSGTMLEHYLQLRHFYATSAIFLLTLTHDEALPRAAGGYSFTKATVIHTL
jgi:hypothetical protein